MTATRALTVDPLTHYRIEVLLAWARIQGGADTGLVAAGLERADGIAARDPALLSWHVAAGGLVAKRTRPVRDLLGELADLPENPAAVPWESRNVLGWRGDLRADAGLVGPAIVDLEHVVSMVDEGGLEAALPHRHALLGLCHWFAGQWNKARLHLRLALDLGASESPVAAAIVPLLDIGTGELAEADRKLARAPRAARTQPVDGGVRPPRHRAWSRGSTPTTARTGPAAPSTTPCAGRCRRARSGELVKSAPWLAHAALAALWAEEQDDVDECLRLLTTSCDPGAPWVPSMAGWLRGLAAEAAGDQRVALDEIARAGRDPANDLPLYRAHMLLDQARLAADLGDREQAQRAREQAAELYQGLGATAYAARASAELVPPARARPPVFRTPSGSPNASRTC